MIKLRKLLALVLAGTLAFSMSVTAFAETAEPAEETAEAKLRRGRRCRRYCSIRDQHIRPEVLSFLLHNSL